MTLRHDQNLALLALVPGLGLVAAVVAFTVLSDLAKPAHYRERTRALNAELAQAQSLLRTSGDPNAYPAKALCRTSPDQAALDLRQRLQSQAAVASVAISEIASTPQPAGSEQTTPVTLQFTASGRYDQVVGLLSAVAKSEPQIFVDTLDLRPEAINVRLKFTGRAFCSNSARP